MDNQNSGCTCIVRQGDQYAIGLTVRDIQGAEITPDNVTGLRVRLGQYELIYPGKLEYEDSQWILPLTQRITYSLSPSSTLSIQAMMPNGDIYSTGSIPFPVEVSDFEGVW